MRFPCKRGFCSCQVCPRPDWRHCLLCVDHSLLPICPTFFPPQQTGRPNRYSLRLYFLIYLSHWLFFVLFSCLWLRKNDSYKWPPVTYTTLNNVSVLYQKCVIKISNIQILTQSQSDNPGKFFVRDQPKYLFWNYVILILLAHYYNWSPIVTRLHHLQCHKTLKLQYKLFTTL